MKHLALVQNRHSFVALDFETADYGRDSACAVAVVRVVENCVTERVYSLLRPPRNQFVFSDLHGIRWNDVKGQPTFAEFWPSLQSQFEQVDFIAAHNAGFDRGVLQACCDSSQILPPSLPFVCTVQLSRRLWKLPSYNLASVCAHLDIPLQHHQALSDAEGCAGIVLAARLIQPVDHRL